LTTQRKINGAFLAFTARNITAKQAPEKMAWTAHKSTENRGKSRRMTKIGVGCISKNGGFLRQIDASENGAKTGHLGG
jgi:hypothetical protein